jgi:hypothetical protein
MGHPNTCKSLVLGFRPVQAKYGVVPVDLCGRRFFRYTACLIAHDQYSGPMLVLVKMAFMIVASVLLGCSANPFW